MCVCVCGEQGNTTTKKWSFVCIGELPAGLSFLFDNSSNSVCVCGCVGVSVICVIVVVLVRDGQLTQRATKRRMPHRPSVTDVEEVFFIYLFAVLLFFVRHFVFVWSTLPCEPVISSFLFLIPIYVYFSLLLFALEKKRRSVFFVCLFLPPSSSRPTSNQYLNY